ELARRPEIRGRRKIASRQSSVPGDPEIAKQLTVKKYPDPELPSNSTNNNGHSPHTTGQMVLDTERTEPNTEVRKVFR
ncbi:MAG: hypothetical protein J5I98_11580, partial [Phaeodactylibacter sp.]|nr:hypothetical protein [Phaeodactylibacter sp.]